MTVVETHMLKFQYCTLTSSKSSIGHRTHSLHEAQLSADDGSISEVPVVITHCAPRPIIVHLNPPLQFIGATLQSDGEQLTWPGQIVQTTTYT